MILPALVLDLFLDAVEDDLTKGFKELGEDELWCFEDGENIEDEGVWWGWWKDE